MRGPPVARAPWPQDAAGREPPSSLRRRCPGALALACLPLAALALGAPASPAGATTPTPRVLTGSYQLYCPDPVETPIVLRMRTTATLAPPHPAPGGRFVVSGFQTKVNFPQGLASALSQMSPITGSVKATILLVGANPGSLAVVEPFVASVPRSLPAQGFAFFVPGNPATLGTFTASSAPVAVEEGSSFRLTLKVGQGKGAETRVLGCRAFPNATADTKQGQPWLGTGEPPIADAIRPVIALG